MMSQILRVHLKKNLNERKSADCQYKNSNTKITASQAYFLRKNKHFFKYGNQLIFHNTSPHIHILL